ncbi:DNA-3-methyladenine glycosylase 2 family protein [Celerinatantimonas yamalensis]|uniref:DNA-3-methyladenine glycosylase II n=1 Tax=Celerinatantimonas yamalensis TaxID=559956 RepID=A0ABW9G4A0_9GAMM
MLHPYTDLTAEQCRQARLSRDRRFDGCFFIAVKTTGIFCRPICPAKLPSEENVEYFSDKTQALQAGYRPCLRCRPDSAPSSWAWKGVETTYLRALRNIEQGALTQGSVAYLAERLGITDRYLRQLFQRYLGMSPKQYDLYQKLMFAKQLLHSSSLSVTDIGFAAGFNSTRRFQDAFRKQMKLRPSDIRRNQTVTARPQIQLSYRGKLNWPHMLAFYRLRAIKGLETVDEHSYARQVRIGDHTVGFRIMADNKQRLMMEVQSDAIDVLKPLICGVRRMLDLDADTEVIEQYLGQLAHGMVKQPGIRIPGVWNPWEAGVRAILGQQVSVKGATTKLNQLVEGITTHGNSVCFPTPDTVADGDLEFLKMPQSRKDTLKRFAEHIRQYPDSDPMEWLKLKGIGPWTVSYAQLRGLSLTDCFLVSDLIVKKQLAHFSGLSEETVSPWGSYATFHLWNQ